MTDEINTLSEKWQDVLDTAEKSEYEVIALAQEILEDLAWLKKLNK